MTNIKELKQSLRAMSIEQLQEQLLLLRKEQFTLRLKAINGVLSQTHLKTVARKTIARIKTLMTEKQGESL